MTPEEIAEWAAGKETLPAEKNKGGRPPGSKTEKPIHKSIETYTNPNHLIDFMNRSVGLPADVIEATVVAGGYAAAVWQFRAAALKGDYNTTKALEIWLKWAQTVIEDQQKPPAEENNSPGSVAFIKADRTAPPPGTEKTNGTDSND